MQTFVGPLVPPVDWVGTVLDAGGGKTSVRQASADRCRGRAVLLSGAEKREVGIYA